MRRLLLLLILLVTAALAEDPAWAEGADAVILHYDSQGRVVGREEVAPRPPDVKPDGATPPQESGERVVPGELIVAAPGGDHALSFVGLGFTVIDARSLGAFGLTAYRLALPKSLTDEEAVRRLHEAIPGLTIDRHHLLDPTAARGTALEQAGSLLDWTVKGTTCGGGLRLGMVDGAVELAHPALKGRRITYRSFHDPDHQPAAADHGTAIAAMLVGKAPWGGLLPEAELLAANIFERKAGGSVSAKTFGLIKALDWLARSGVTVVNMSVAGPPNKVLLKVIGLAARRGMVLLAAAGNNGPEAPPAYPAAAESVLAVTAVDRHRQIYRKANRGAYIDFAAPGVSLWTAVPGGGRFQSGTSFAVPFVAALAALALADGDSEAAGLRRRLAQGVRDLGAPGRDEVYGRGLIHAAAACSLLSE